MKLFVNFIMLTKKCLQNEMIVLYKTRYSKWVSPFGRIVFM